MSHQNEVFEFELTVFILEFSNISDTITLSLFYKRKKSPSGRSFLNFVAKEDEELQVSFLNKGLMN